MSADAYLPDGTPLYIKCARGNGKSMRQLELYAKLLGTNLDELRNILEENDTKPSE